jgi:GT2 family glycosyltransferase
MCFFSVVIPTYNRAALLPKTLATVFAQEFADFEIIVVDDGSTDGSQKVLESYGDRLRFFQQENNGPGAARNLGVAHSTGEYIAFLDSDDCWFPWTLSTYAQVIASTRRPGLLCGGLQYFTDENELAEVMDSPAKFAVFPDYFTAGRKGLYCGSGQLAVRRETFVETGGFAEGKINSEDHDLIMRLGTASGFVNVTAPVLVAYRQHPEASTRDLTKTFAGSMHLLEMERTGRYPGGAERRRDRRRILSNHLRPLSISLLAQGEWKKAWLLYRRTFAWNLALGRLRYLTGFPIKAVL